MIIAIAIVVAGSIGYLAGRAHGERSALAILTKADETLIAANRAIEESSQIRRNAELNIEHATRLHGEITAMLRDVRS